MVIPTVGAVVVIPFPFSDLSQSKLRPAVVLASAGSGDWILCQVTSNAYADLNSVPITSADFTRGRLRVASYVRPGKLFTANQRLLVSEIGRLRGQVFTRIVNQVVALLRPGT